MIMTQKNALKLFDEKKVRTLWDDELEKWYFSIVDVVEVLTDSPRPRKYWNALKTKLQKEGSQLSLNVGQLKMLAVDGKKYMTDVADTEQVFRLIQSIPSPKAEPFKLWLAQIANERLDETLDPELTIDRAMEQYMRLGYSESWINQRLKSIEIRKELTDEWKKRGVEEGIQFATLTDIITESGLAKQQKHTSNTKVSKRKIYETI
jgi:prophage antirepressor-like protein